MAALAVGSVAACSHDDNPVRAVPNSETSTTFESIPDVKPTRPPATFDDVSGLTEWLSAQGVECTVRADNKSCDLKSINGAEVAPEVVEAVVASDTDAIDAWELNLHSGFILSQDVWAIHVDTQATADAIQKAIPDADFLQVIR